MANVLPEERRKELRAFFDRRFVLLTSIALAIAGILTLLSLVPAYAIVHDSNSLLEIQEEVPTHEREDIARAQFLIAELLPLSTSTSSTLELIQKLVNAKPSGVRLTALHIIHGQKGNITLGGSASSRETVNTFKVNLSKEARFKSVTIPLGALAGDEGRFSITISGSF